jgi:hypothetical protein
MPPEHVVTSYDRWDIRDASYFLVSASSDDMFPQSKQVDRAFIELRYFLNGVALLTMEFG